MEIEACRGEPVDIEWAILDGKVFLLQVLPITTYLPLPDVLITAPGKSSSSETTVPIIRPDEKNTVTQMTQ